MSLDVVSKADYDILELRVKQLEQEKLEFIKQLDSVENRLDFLITLLKPHLSPLQKRKLENKLQTRGYF